MKDLKILAIEEVLYRMMTQSNAVRFYVENLQPEWFHPYENLFLAIKEVWNKNPGFQNHWKGFLSAEKIYTCEILDNEQCKATVLEYMDISIRYDERNCFRVKTVDEELFKFLTLIEVISKRLEAFEMEHGKMPDDNDEFITFVKQNINKKEL